MRRVRQALPIRLAPLPARRRLAVRLPGAAALPLVALAIAGGAAPAVVMAAEETPTPSEPTAGPIPVLGSKAFAKPYGAGFGHVEPETIFNGGDPSGEVSKIRWTGWGNPSAIGYGLNSIFKPHGGYYRKPAKVELRATKLGKCGKQRAYTKLEARIPKKPGGKLGKWFSWSGTKTICKPPY